jgi:predicted esterase
VSAAEAFVHRYEPGSGLATLLLLHGTGGDEHQLISLGRQLAPTAALLSPRGKVLEGGVAARFFARRGMGNLDLDDLRVRGDELAQWVGDASAQYGRDPERVIALGYSNGANIAVELLFRHGGVLRGAALLRPMLPYEPEETPALAGTDVLVDAGERDPYSSLEQTGRLAEILRDGGADVTLHVEPGAGHNLTPGDIATAARWIAELSG